MSQDHKVKPRARIFIAHPSQHLTDHLANGDGLVAHSMISGLAARGYELHVAADQVSLRNPFPANVTLYPLRLRSRNRALRLLEYAVRMRLLFQRLRRIHRFDLILQMNPVYPGLSLALLGTGLPIILGTYVPRWGAGGPQFRDGYQGSSGLAAKGRDWVVALQQAHADALLLTTPAAMNRVPRLMATSPKINYLPHSIDTEFFHPPGEEAGKPVTRHTGILFVGSVSERKGIFTLLEAFPQVLAAIPEARLTIVGPGDDLARAKQYVADSEHKERIQIVGPVSRGETAAFYRQHALYCLPSYGEPYATSLLEAMASGLPVVSTDTGGTPFLVPTEGGRLIAPGDVQGLASALIELLSSASLRQTMGALNRSTMVETYSPARVFDQLEAVYSKVTHGKVGYGPMLKTSSEVPAHLTQS